MTGSDAAQHQQQEAISECALAWQTLRLAHDRVAQRLGAELSAACGLAINEFDVLLFLRSHAHEQVRIGALLEAVPLSQPALSRLVARLEARGLLARSGAEGDARAVVVGLTDTGAALIDRALAIHARVVHETLTSKFSPPERAALLRTLRQIGQ
jgi:DNA-binding MarR family transcriptional regulator